MTTAPLRRLRAAVARIATLDLRSLAVFRVGLGLLLAADAVDRLPDAWALLSDEGVLPRADVPRLGAVFTLLSLSGSVWWARAVLGVQALAGLAIAAGAHTRWAIAVGWIALISVEFRNPLLLYGADLLLQTLLVWAWFLPVAAVASIDERAGRAVGGPQRSLATFGYLVQIAVLYLATWALKTGVAWEDGTAGWYVLHVDHFTNEWGRAALAYPELLRLGTHATMLLELVGPLLLFVPVWVGALRGLVVSAMWAFHVSLGLTLSIGWWPLISVLCWVPMVPASWWERLGWRPGEATARAAGQWVREGLVGAMLAMVLAVNLAVVDRDVKLPRRVWTVARALHLNQNWNMYAPTPLRDDGWMVVSVELADGSKVDALRGGAEVSWSKPANVARHYGGQRWQRLMRSLWERRGRPQREPYLRWVCEHAALPGEPVSAALIYLREETPDAPAWPGAAKRIRLGTISCDPAGREVVTSP